MKKNEFIIGEIYTYCQQDYCYLGFQCFPDGDLCFCMESDYRKVVALGKETFKRIIPVNRKYLTVSKLQEGETYLTPNGEKIIGRREAKLDFLGYVRGVDGKKEKPFLFELADGNGYVNLSHKDIRKLKLCTE